MIPKDLVPKPLPFSLATVMERCSHSYCWVAGGFAGVFTAATFGRTG